MLQQTMFGSRTSLAQKTKKLLLIKENMRGSVSLHSIFEIHNATLEGELARPCQRVPSRAATIEAMSRHGLERIDYLAMNV